MCRHEPVSCLAVPGLATQDSPGRGRRGPGHRWSWLPGRDAGSRRPRGARRLDHAVRRRIPGAVDVYFYLDGDDLTRLVELAEDGKLTVHIDRAFPLEEAAQAQQLLAGGHVRGKVVLETRREEGSASYVRALKKRVESGH
ncbi:zinc-binding dehydrogenase [Streptomyces sp. NPDC020802]|uniref:zinc-binding dehydrogenase n=1 Tax=Streptomyces sp. NPDC020802 TaxID=3365094 RepID=UPI003787FCE3